MVMHVYDNAKACKGLDRVIIATDSERIANVCGENGAEVVMTGSCSSGTERVFAALKSLDEDYDIIINIQGDEPLIHASHIQELISIFEMPLADIGTLAEKLMDESENQDPNTVKLIFKEDDIVEDFTRKPLNGQVKCKHVGLYGFRVSIIDDLLKLPFTERRKNEKLEQLDWLLSYTIHARIIEGSLISVDTKEDLERVKHILEAKADNL